MEKLFKRISRLNHLNVEEEEDTLFGRVQACVSAAQLPKDSKTHLRAADSPFTMQWEKHQKSQRHPLPTNAQDANPIWPVASVRLPSSTTINHARRDIARHLNHQQPALLALLKVRSAKRAWQL